MIRPHPWSTRNDTLFPASALFRFERRACDPDTDGAARRRVRRRVHRVSPLSGTDGVSARALPTRPDPGTGAQRRIAAPAGHHPGALAARRRARLDRTATRAARRHGEIGRAHVCTPVTNARLVY